MEFSFLANVRSRCVRVCAVRPTPEGQRVHAVPAQSADGVLPHRQHRRRPGVAVGQVSRGCRQVHCRCQSSSVAVKDTWYYTVCSLTIRIRAVGANSNPFEKAVTAYTLSKNSLVAFISCLMWCWRLVEYVGATSFPD